MSCTSGTSFLYQSVMERMADRLRSVSAKQIQRVTGTAKVTALKAKAGLIPKTDAFLSVLRSMPPGDRLDAISPLFDDVDVFGTIRRVAAMVPTLKELAGHVEEITRANAAGRDGLRAVLGFGSGQLDRSGAGASRVGGLDAIAAHHQSSGEAGGDGLALVETRRLDGIPGRDGEALRRHLTALDNVVSLDAARALVKGDNYGRTGLAYKRPGEDWTALVAPENRLWTPSPDPRPITEFAGNVVQLRRDLDEAARSTSPVFVSHAGALLRDGDLIPFHSNVVRIPGRAKCGAALVLTDFCRLGARA